MKPTAPAVRIPGANPSELVAYVAAGNREVRVRFDHRRGRRFRCDTCGWSTTATCPHSRAVIAAVIKQLATEGETA